MAESSSPQKITSLSEQQIIDLFACSTTSPNAVGIGDDCAVLDADAVFKQLVSTDLLAEEVHFRLDDITANALGYKALAVNLSDIAACGGTPKGFFLSLALPGRLTVEWVKDFRDGMMSLANRFRVPLLGGDTTRSDSLAINVTILGAVDPIHLKLRSAAMPGDIVCVTAPLGDAAAGLAILNEPNAFMNLPEKYRKTLIRRHCRPEPEVIKGQWLAEQKGVHAMIDLSDGLKRDALHIAESSECCVDIYLDDIPQSEAYNVFVESRYANQKLGQGFAVSGGEDYHLLLTVAEDKLDRLQKEYKKRFSSILHPIGVVRDDEPQVCFMRDQVPVDIKEQEFKHFKNP